MTKKVITATNVFLITKFEWFAKSVRKLLKIDGVLLIEAHYFGNLIKDTAFDTIYHRVVLTVASGKKILDLNGLNFLNWSHNSSWTNTMLDQF